MSNSKNYITVSISRDVHSKVMNNATPGSSFNAALEQKLGVITLNLSGRPMRTTYTEQEFKEFINKLFLSYSNSKEFKAILKGSIVDLEKEYYE